MNSEEVKHSPSIELTLHHNEMLDCCTIRVGDWHAELIGADYDPCVLSAYKEHGIDTLYAFVALELHSVQQCQSELYYRGLPVHAERMEDTCGAEMKGDEVVVLGTVRMPLILLDKNYTVKIKDSNEKAW